MSEGDYEYDPNEYPDEDPYEGMDDNQEEDIETKVELTYFEIEERIRKNETDAALKELQELYTLAEQNKLRGWKVKILNQQLQIHCRRKNQMGIKQVLSQLAQLNKTDKIGENSIKGIITVIKSLDKDLYKQNRAQLNDFISVLDPVGQAKCNLIFLERAVQENEIKEADQLFRHINSIAANPNNEIPASTLLELYSLEITHSKNTHLNIHSKIRMIELKLPMLEKQAFMNEGHLSILKRAIADISFLDCSYESCCEYLTEAFLQNVKYGKTSHLKELVKLNVLVCLLCEDREKISSEKYNPLLHESTVAFKTEKDVQALYGLVDSFTSNDIAGFQSNYEMVQPVIPEEYKDIREKLMFQLKKAKLKSIVVVYKRVSFDYLQKRLSTKEPELVKILFSLIVEEEIYGKIHNHQGAKYLEVLPRPNEFLTVQLENLQEMEKRYL